MNITRSLARSRRAAGSSPTAKYLKSPFLEGLAEADRDVIVAAASHRRFLAESVVAHQGDTADRLFLLIEGWARFFFVNEDGRKVLLHWLAAGDIFGGAALVSAPYHYLVSTETIQDSRLLVWSRPTIRRLAARYPRLLDNALAIATTDYLSWYVAAHAALTSNTAPQRLAQVLVTLARRIGHATQDGVELEVSNEELASAANMTAFTVSRLLNKWQRNDAVVKNRGRLLLRSPERLFVRLT